MRPTRVTRRQAKNRASHRTPVPGRATDQASGGQFAVRTASSRVLSINACLQQLWNPVLVGSKVLAVKNAAVTKSLEPCSIPRPTRRRNFVMTVVLTADHQLAQWRATSVQTYARVTSRSLP